MTTLSNRINKPFVSRLKKYWPLYLLAIWPIAQFIVFYYLPMYGIVIAFKDYKPGRGILNSDWVGFENFVKVFTDRYFFRVLGNTLRISSVSLLISFPMTIAFALLINEIRWLKIKKTIQTITYMPYFLSWVVVGVFVYQVLSPNYGIVNTLLVNLGIIKESIFFVTQPKMFLPMYILANLWKNLGYSVVIYLAAIAGINPELYESSTLDGANRFQNIRYITLPGIATTISTMFILSVSGLISVGFDPIFNLYNDSTREVADVISTYVYRKGIVSYDYSYATAVGLFQNVISLLLILGTNWLARRLNPDYQII